MPFRSRSAFGDLERALLEVLWQRPGERLTGREVLDALTDDPAYTTVMTVLDRMAAKGLVVREKEGRVGRYGAAGTRGEMTAELLRETLVDVPDEERAAALVAFVSDASTSDRAALQAALDRLAEPDPGPVSQD